MRVGIVGAGISGVVAGAHLKKANINITVFERSKAPGGVWLYDDQIPLEPTYPATDPSKGDVKEHFEPACQDSSDNKLIRHAPPGPAYEGLMNNVSTRLMKLKLNAWPPGTPDFVSHHVLAEYIRNTAGKTGVHEKTVYGTRVEKIEKNGRYWDVTTSTLHDYSESTKISERFWSFDAVVIASGHYHACRIPDIPGLAQWKTRWPDRVQHSKTYRRPSPYKGQNVLLIGAGVSSTDIARELGPVANTIYQTSRGGAFDLPPKLLPPNGIRIRDIKSFDMAPSTDSDTNLDHMTPIPGTIHLRDNHTLTNIHRIIVCTGYHMSLPFLRSHHSDATPAHAASPTVLVTDGTQLHNLHQDIFYVPDPTLAFIGVPYFTATFSLFEFQAIALAAVWSGKANLPTEEQMREAYEERVARKGSGKGFHSLRGEEVGYVDGLLGWLNGDGERVGAERVEGHSREWHEANEERIKMMKERSGEGSF